MTFRKLFASLILSAVAILPPSQALGDKFLSSEEKKVLKEVESQVGKIAKPDKYPAMQGHLEKIFDRVSEAQAKFFPDHQVPMNSIFLIDSPSENAFVVMVPDAKIPSRSTHMVFMTTSMYESLYPASSAASGVLPDDLRTGDDRVAGVIAHELEHPIEKIESGTLSSSWIQRKTRSQGVELITDHFGTAIAEEAGFARDGLYSALDVLSPQGPGSILFSAASTHPEHEFRQSANRIGLTQREFDRGKQQNIQPMDRQSLGLVKELKEQKIKSLRIYTPPKTIEEASSRLLKMREKRIAERVTFKNFTLTQQQFELEFNRLAVDLDRMVQSKSPSLTESEWEAFLNGMEGYTDLDGKLRESNRYAIADRVNKKRIFSANNGSSKFLALPTHEEYLETSWVYKHEKYRKWLESKFELLTDTGVKADHAWQLRKARRLLDSKSLFYDYQVPIVRSLKNASYSRLTELDLTLDTEAKIRMAYLYHTKVFTPETPMGQFGREFQHKWPNTILPLTQGGQPTHLLDAEDAKNFSESLRANLRYLQRETYKEIWKNAGYWGIIDISQNKENIDWKTIWRELGISPEAGARELNSRVREFTRRPDHAEIAKSLQIETPARFHGDWTRSYKMTPIDWPEKDLIDDLTGPRGGAPKLTQAFYSTLPQHLKQRYRDVLAKKLADLPRPDDLTFRQIETIHQEIANQLLPGKTFPVTVDDMWALEIDRLKMSPEIKKTVLKEMYLGPKEYPDPKKSYARNRGQLLKDRGKDLYSHDWRPKGGISKNSNFLHLHDWEYPHYYHIGSDKKAISDVLIKNGVISSVSGMLETVLPVMGDDHYRLTTSFSEELIQEIDQIKNAPYTSAQKKNRLQKMVSQVLEPRADLLKYRLQYVDQNVLKQLNAKVFEVMDTLPFTLSEKREMFDRLTTVLPSQQSDAYFKKHFLNSLPSGDPALSQKTYVWSLNNKRIESSILRTEVADRLIHQRVQQLKRIPPTTEEANQLFKQIDEWIPHASLARDDLLEKTAWRLKLKGNALKVLEEYKSYNPRLFNPNLARLGSAYSNYATRLEPSARLALIDYLLNPEERPFPTEVETAVSDFIHEDSLLKNMKMDEEEVGKLRAAGEDFIEKIQKSLIDTQVTERVPLLEMLIEGGPNSLARAPDFPTNVTRKILKSVVPDSTEEKLLKILLKNVDPKMRATALSMLLTQQLKNGVLEAARIYEAFGPFGIRFAQMVSRWDLFGPEHSAQIEHLKYNAKPLTLKEIEDIAKKTLTAAEFDQIDHFMEMKGSGTNRAVVKVKLKDGSTPVMLVQRPHAKAQIETVADLARNALADAKTEKLFNEIELVDFLVEDTREQMLSELFGKDEAVRISRATEFYEKLNADPEFKKALNGYTFEVPRVLPESKFKVYDNLFFMEHFDGDVFSKVPAEVQEKLGEAIARSSIEGRILYGVGNVDLHKGNVLVNQTAKKLGMIDTAGWWYELTEAERVGWQKFLVASATQDQKSLLEAGLSLSDSKPTPQQIDAIKEALDDALTLVRRHPEQTKKGALLIQKAFELNGARMRPAVKFGGLMEFMVVSGEGYVKPEQLKAIASETVMKGMFQGRKTLSPVGCDVQKILYRTFIGAK